MTRSRAFFVFSLLYLGLPSVESIAGTHRAEVFSAVDSPTSSGRSALRAAALASADFDEDGVPDLVRGDAGPDGGHLTVYKGDAQALFPRRAAEWNGTAPFVSPGRSVALPIAPDFLGAGDFDGDGHFDVVVASRVSASLYLLSGDGQGGFERGSWFELQGSVVALLVGELGRLDGLADLVVAVDGSNGPAAILFHGPGGALRSQGSTVPLPQRAVSLALGQLDGDGWADLAVAAGNSLVLVRGKALDAEPWPPRVERLDLPSEVAAVATGRFLDPPKPQQQLALLYRDRSLELLDLSRLGAERRVVRRGRLAETSDPSTAGPSSLPSLRASRFLGRSADDLLLIDPSTARLEVFTDESSSTKGANPPELSHADSMKLDAEPIVVLPMRLNPDALDDLVVLTPDPGASRLVLSSIATTYTVTNANESGGGSLRQALTNANNNGGTDSIQFNISGTGPFVISPTTPLPAITGSVILDGYTQSGAQANTVAAPGVSDAVLMIVIDGSLSTAASGITINGGSSTVRGLDIGNFANDGISVNSNGNIIEGNYIGTDAAGLTGVANGNGIQIVSSDNRIGGTAVGSRNLLSGNDDDGVDLQTNGATSNQIQGNFIGTDVTGSAALPNLSDGVQLIDAPSNLVGGTTAGAGNLISGNDDVGVFVDALGSSGNTVQGNLIGSNISGVAALGNGEDGVVLKNAPSNTIGGTTVAARNVIAANAYSGVWITEASAAQNLVQGNYIGTDSSGTVSLGNLLGGVEIKNATNNTIGGTSDGARNVISGNAAQGILITQVGSSGNRVQGNYVGLDATGAAPLGNLVDGVKILSAPNNSIGGVTAGHRNVISANGRGVLVQLAAATGNLVQGNYIGTDATGTTDLGNTQQGVLIGEAASNLVGGTSPGLGNLIVGNDASGVFILGNGAVGNSVLGNSITANGLLGVDLGGNTGVTANDTNDGDAGGNGLQNFPVITAVVLGGSTTTVDGTLNSAPNSSYRVEVFANADCDSSLHGEGSSYLGSATVVSDAGGNGSFSTVFPVVVDVDDEPVFTANATNPSGSTSEFSRCFVLCSQKDLFDQSIRAVDANSMSWTTPASVYFVVGNLASVGTYSTLREGFLTNATSVSTTFDLPTAGNGMYYLVRPEPCGSWQTADGAEPQRDVVLP